MDNNLKEHINNFIKEDEGMTKLANKDFMFLAMIGIVVCAWEEYKKEHGL